MTIGIDARSLVGDISGVGSYLRGVLTADTFGYDTIAYSASPSDGSVEFEGVVSNTAVSPYPVRRLLGSAMPVWWMNLTLPRALRGDDVTCFFGPNFLKPLVCPVPSVVVVHDFVHRVHPETHSPAYRRYLLTFLPHSVRTADRIVVVSESTKRDLRRFHDVSEERVSVAHPAAGPRFRPRTVSPPERERIREMYDLPDEFVLFVGNIEPRKNLTALVRAIKELPADERIPLVIVGQEHVPNPKFQSVLSENWTDDLVLQSGYVPDDDLPLLYNLASVFVYPSIYEGFGIPPLEAMQSGTPVVTSNRSSLPEVVGDAGITVNPTDIAAISRAIGRLLDDEVAAEHRRRGIERARQFSWDETARVVADAIESAVRDS